LPPQTQTALFRDTPPAGEAVVFSFKAPPASTSRDLAPSAQTSRRDADCGSAIVGREAERGEEILKWAITDQPAHEDASALFDRPVAGFYPTLQGLLSLIKTFISQLY